MNRLVKTFGTLAHWLGVQPRTSGGRMVPALLGGAFGIFATGYLMHVWLGSGQGLPLLIAPIGASAVLLFAVPASPLAQPWAIIGGNTISALCGIFWIKVLGDPAYAACLGVATAIAMMSLARCLHPPGGACALTGVIGGPAVIAAGWPHGESGKKAIGELDDWLRGDGNRRNPGTTADLIAAGLFVLLRTGQLRADEVW